ncbi:lysophospholipid acyltransferase family protein [Variovorax sp. J22R133]|uniref:lysophospholipid acyltransferase family protein n=1 Tax=Variovorax brevis TaxID=3053503 RepID=UPI002576B368|nr:lysophospholipid acyltransferase family protein [Variovorax sp. J22R133]MDM0114959.1 lysophospholipid acyltransferase family protein [Variovorax sp. J22R133]
MRSLLACWKLLRAIACAFSGWCTIRFTFARLTPEQRAERVQSWARDMLGVFGIQVVVQGTPPGHGPMLVVINHLSWLDILAVHAAQHVRFVAKSNIRHWPMLGMMSTGAGTVYIERERPRDALRVVHHMAEALKQGDLIAVFPEGTTGDGRELLPFHANLLQAAISSGAPVLPAALRFAESATGQTSFAPSYIGDESLLDSVWRTLCAPPLTAFVRFGEPQDPQGRDRRVWAQSLHADIDRLRSLTMS